MRRLRSAWQFVISLRGRARARRLGFAFIRCGICGDFVSYESICMLASPAVLMDSPNSGMLVCGKERCQITARTLNRDKFGRDLSDPWIPGQRVEP